MELAIMRLLFCLIGRLEGFLLVKCHRMPGCLHERRPAAPEPGGATPHETTLRLIDWLLSEEVQLPGGSEAGGVLGWFDGASSRFVYPETTGYYLTFLSFLHAHGWPVGGIPHRAPSRRVARPPG
jgi:hypothetical protein